MPEAPRSGAVPLVEAPDERRHLTVMFSDLVGSTELASSLDPEDLHEVIEGYQHRVANVVAQHGGYVAQFQGDGVVVYFGYPEAVETASLDALNAGLALVEAVAQLGAGLPADLGVRELQARVGIHTGEVVVATVRAGGAERLADVFGDVPNLAARLQSAALPGEVIVSDVTASLVSGFFELEPKGALTLKGISRQVPAFRVLRRSTARTRLETGPLTGFVARSSASKWLDDQWRATEDGPARLVLMTGEPGIGKSRLLQEFTVGLADRGFTVSTVYCSRGDSLSPLQPFGPLMGAVPRVPEVAATWVCAQSNQGPAVFAVEDAHWADPSTLESIDLVARSERPVLTVMTARTGIGEALHVQPNRQLAIGRLNPEEAHAIVSGVPGGRGLPTAVSDALVRRADGVPLYLEELTREVVEGDGDLAAAARTPATLSELITARLDRLGPAKRVAQLAAIVGRAFDRSMLQAVSDLDGTTLDAHLQRLIDYAIVEPSYGADGRLWFRHALIHEAAYGSVLRTVRRATHARIGDLLLGANRSDTQPEVVAYHLGAAGRAQEAVTQWRRASRGARQHARFREAAGHEREVLALLPMLPEGERDTIEIQARGRLTLCLTAVDQSSPEAYAEAMRVQELARRSDDRAALLRSYLVLLPWWQANADYRAIESALPEAQGLAAGLGDEWAQGALAQMGGIVSIWQGRLAEGLGHLSQSFTATGLPLEASMDALPPLAPPVVMTLAPVRVGAALGYWLTGQVADAQRIVEDTRRFAASRSVPQAQAVTAATAAIIAQLDGDRPAVVRLAAEAMQLGDEVTTRQWQQWAAALHWWASADGVEPEVPGPLLRPYFLTLLAESVQVPDDRALDLLDEALDTGRTTGERFGEAQTLRVRGEVLAHLGRMDDALAALDEAIATARAQQSRMLELRALTVRAGLPSAPDAAGAELDDCIAALAPNGTSLTLTRAVAASEGP